MNWRKKQIWIKRKPFKADQRKGKRYDFWVESSKTERKTRFLLTNKNIIQPQKGLKEEKRRKREIYVDFYFYCFYWQPHTHTRKEIFLFIYSSEEPITKQWLRKRLQTRESSSNPLSLSFLLWSATNQIIKKKITEKN